MRLYEPYERWNGRMYVRTEVYTFPGLGESVTCTYHGEDPDPTVGRRDYRD